ncbi:MAG TPA: MFS transporter [Bryobacteraceae bacterium]|nr:MFS transporter [Bryobacteraceae bacterium]
MPATTQGTPVSATGRQPTLQAATGRRVLGGFFLSGVLFSFLGAVLPAWGYHLHSDHGTAGLYFLFLTFGIYVGAQLCHWLVARTGLRILLAAGSAVACLGLLALAYLSGPQPPSFRMFALFFVGAAGAVVNTAVFHAIAPFYRHDPSATINLSGGLFFLGCLTTALLTAGTFDFYTVPSMLILLAVIPFFFTIGFARGGPYFYTPHEFPTFQKALADFRSPGAILFTLLLFFQFGNEWAIAGWLPLFLIQQLGMSPTSGILLLALYWVALLAGRIVAQAMMPRLSHTKMLMGSVLAALFGCVLLSLTEKMGGAVTGILLIGGGFASIYPLTVESIAHRFPYYHPGFFGGIFSLGLVGGLLTPALLGLVAQQWGTGKVMLLPALGSIMVCLLVLLIWLETRLSRGPDG